MQLEEEKNKFYWSERYENNKVKQEKGKSSRISRDRSGKLKVMYTNVGGLLSTKLEVKNFLKTNDTDILCLVEAKLNDAVAHRR